MSIGQRVSVLVNARNEVDDPFDWPIFANMDPEMFDYVSFTQNVDYHGAENLTRSPTTFK